MTTREVAPDGGPRHPISLKATATPTVRVKDRNTGNEIVIDRDQYNKDRHKLLRFKPITYDAEAQRKKLPTRAQLGRMSLERLKAQAEEESVAINATDDATAIFTRILNAR